MGRAIFISYRRDDSEGEAGRLFDDLVRSFDENSVFMDVSGINPGADFRKAIDDNVAGCGVLLAVIGPGWSSIKSSTGGRRLDDPNDFVRLEIASALARNIAVIPVLVHDAKMPRPEDLPDNLKDLAFRNSVEITHARWNSDVQLLTKALTRYVAPTAAADTTPVHATVTVQLPPPTSPPNKPGTSRPSSVPLILAVVAAVVLALGVVAWIMFRPHNPLIGTWTNSEPVQGNTLARLEIRSNGGNSLSIHAWGKCQQPVCDWGTRTADFDGQQAKATWQIGGTAEDPARTSSVTIRPDNGQLTVSIANTFSDRPPNGRQAVFVKEQESAPQR